jgi:NADPH:quinone reductase
MWGIKCLKMMESIMPKMIKRVQFSQTGDYRVLSFEQYALAELGDYDVVVDNKAIGVNFIDTYHRSGLYPLSLPSGLGKEAAGLVVALGAKVTLVQLGDRVAYVNGPLGAYSAAHIVPETALIKLPPRISFETAAAMMLKGLTAAYLLLKTYPLKASDTILVHAAAGGVSSILIPWAKAIGARVIGTVGSEAKIAIAKANGCDEVLLYRKDNVPAEIHRITSGKKVDVVYDSVGKDTFTMSLDCLRPRGLLVSFGNASGAVPDFSPLLLSSKGSLFLTRPTLFDYISDPKEQQELADALFDRVHSEDVVIKITKQLLLSEAGEAHRLLESGATTGSLVLIPDKQ